MKWNGKVTENFIQEKKGNRQGGMSSAEVYNNAMTLKKPVQKMI